MDPKRKDSAGKPNNQSEEDTLQTGFSPEDWEQQQREQGDVRYPDDLNERDTLLEEEELKREENEGGANSHKS
jgi:hypothetical protein